MRALLISIVACTLFGLGFTGHVFAQQYPTKPIRFIVPFAPGGGVDLIGRSIAQKLNEAWGQPVVVDNRGGGGGNIGTDMVAKAPPDGYTLLMGYVGNLAINPFLFKTVTHIKIVHIPYKGDGPAIIDILGGQVQLMFSAPGAVLAHVKERLAVHGYDVTTNAPPEFAAFLKADLAKWEKVVKASGARVD